METKEIDNKNICRNCTFYDETDGLNSVCGFCENEKSPEYKTGVCRWDTCPEFERSENIDLPGLEDESRIMDRYKS